MNEIMIGCSKNKTSKHFIENKTQIFFVDLLRSNNKNVFPLNKIVFALAWLSFYKHFVNLYLQQFFLLTFLNVFIILETIMHTLYPL